MICRYFHRKLKRNQNFLTICLRISIATIKPVWQTALWWGYRPKHFSSPSQEKNLSSTPNSSKVLNIRARRNQIDAPCLAARRGWTIWVQLLTDLINRKDSSAQTFRQIYYENQSKEEFGRLKSWFEEAEREKEDAMPGNHNMGHAKIAFSYGLRILNYIAKGK